MSEITLDIRDDLKIYYDPGNENNVFTIKYEDSYGEIIFIVFSKNEAKNLADFIYENLGIKI